MPMEPLIRICGVPVIPSSGTHLVAPPVEPLVAPMGNGLDHVTAARFPARKVIIPPGVPISAFPVEAEFLAQFQRVRTQADQAAAQVVALQAKNDALEAQLAEQARRNAATVNHFLAPVPISDSPCTVLSGPVVPTAVVPPISGVTDMSLSGRHYAYKSLKLPMPKSISVKVLEQNVDNSAYLTALLEDIFAYLGGGVGRTYDWDSGLRAFMEAPDAKLFHTTFFDEMKTSGGQFDSKVYIAKFISAFTGDVRPLHVVALHELHAGKITQGALPVAKYSERFHQRSRQLPGESQSSLCLHFLNGLKPELRARCCLDRDNNRWDSLAALVQFTLAEEERLNLISSTSDLPHLSCSSQPESPHFFPFGSRRHRDWGHKGKMEKRQRRMIFQESEVDNP